MNHTLLSPAHLSDLDLENHIVMAPMTRSRADENGVPGDLTPLYYAQRASAGLIISEAINISIDAIGYPLTPGLFNEEQITQWKKVTNAVHEKGGLIFAQLWHTGRVGHSLVRNGKLPVAPSPIAIAKQKHFTSNGLQAYETPKELLREEIHTIIHDYKQAAQNAKKAGFDGIELHAAFGYLPNQFLVDGANQRTDEYGGSIENRCRFVLEVMQALSEEWDSKRIGIKLSPSIPFNNMIDSNPESLYKYLFAQLNKFNLGYIHLMNPLFPLTAFPHWPKDVLGTFRQFIECPVIANGGYNADTAEIELNNNRADLISFGNLFIANPDLPERFKIGAPLATADKESMYGGGEHGYTDYPNLNNET